jgi:hypothetical protein
VLAEAADKVVWRRGISIIAIGLLVLRQLLLLVVCLLWWVLVRGLRGE